MHRRLSVSKSQLPFPQRCSPSLVYGCLLSLHSSLQIYATDFVFLIQLLDYSIVRHPPTVSMPLPPYIGGYDYLTSPRFHQSSIFSFSTSAISLMLSYIQRNTFSADCVHSKGINMFKNIIYNDLVRSGYT